MRNMTASAANRRRSEGRQRRSGLGQQHLKWHERAGLLGERWIAMHRLSGLLLWLFASQVQFYAKIARLESRFLSLSQEKAALRIRDSA
jgi:hypothetical protein